jgi:hypothetical protein
MLTYSFNLIQIYFLPFQHAVSPLYPFTNFCDKNRGDSCTRAPPLEEEVSEKFI